MKRLKQVDITDIRSIAQMTMKPGALNVISGDNGEGKTSVLMAIEAVFKGGSNGSNGQGQTFDFCLFASNYLQSAAVVISLFGPYVFRCDQYRANG